jgi:hypothetical protein
MPSDETFEEKVIRLLELILKRLSEIERQVPISQNPQDYGDPI